MDSYLRVFFMLKVSLYIFLAKSLVITLMAQSSKTSQGWGFIVKQGASTIHEDSAVYEVSTSSLTMEMEAVTHALCGIASRGDSPTTHAIILTYSMNLLRKVEWEAQAGMCQCSTPTYPPSKNPVGVLYWTCRSQRK